MLHTEYFGKADHTYECRHNDNEEAIHILQKDGEAIVFGSLWDLVCYHFSGDKDIERFYLLASELFELYECEDYDYYSVKKYWENRQPPKLKSPEL